jgi:hypothetical protein
MASTRPAWSAGRHVREGQLHELDRRGVAPGLADRGPDGGIADVLQGVDRDPLAGQVGGRLDRGVPGDHAAEVGLVLAGGGDPVGHHLEGQPARLAISSEVTLLNPNWNGPLTTPGTIAAPPWPLSRVSSMLRLVKNPFCLPR